MRELCVDGFMFSVNINCSYLLAGKVITSYSSHWFMQLLLCASAPLVLCCDQFDRGSKQVKRESVDLVRDDYDVSLCQRIDFSHSWQ